VAPESRRRGVAATSLRLASEWAFSELGLRHVEADPDGDNLAAHRMLERAGFRREGLARLRAIPPRTVVIYSLRSERSAAS